MNNEIFLPAFEKLSKIANANKNFTMCIMQVAFEMTAKSKYNDDPEQPTGYIMKVEPRNRETGIHYRFERCPIAEFAKQNGYLDVMPALCNGDYPAMELLHAALIRRHTCANSDICDYWIVGDESSYAKEHPKKVDEAGYFYND